MAAMQRLSGLLRHLAPHAPAPELAQASPTSVSGVTIDAVEGRTVYDSRGGPTGAVFRSLCCCAPFSLS